jgi:hypothetical protein
MNILKDPIDTDTQRDTENTLIVTDTIMNILIDIRSGMVKFTGKEDLVMIMKECIRNHHPDGILFGQLIDQN